MGVPNRAQNGAKSRATLHGVLGSRVSGRSHCRVAAFSVSGLHESDFLFITISHCAWRHVISLSKATKKRSKENAFRTRAHKWTQRAVSTFLAPQKHGARQSNGCVNPSFSRILTRTRFAPYALGQALFVQDAAQPYTHFLLHFLMCWLRDPDGYFRRSRLRHHVYCCFILVSLS